MQYFLIKTTMEDFSQTLHNTSQTGTTELLYHFDNVQYCKGVTVVSEVLVLAEVEINVNRSIWLII